MVSVGVGKAVYGLTSYQKQYNKNKENKKMKGEAKSNGWRMDNNAVKEDVLWILQEKKEKKYEGFT